MSFRRDDEVKLGGTVSAFFGGHVAGLRITAAEFEGKSFTSENAASNGEALRSALIAALCWLDGHELLVTPALRGDVVIRPERKRNFEDEP
jgi:hypothetical protein